MEQDGGDGAAMELSHAIGFNGGANQPLHIEPSGTGFMYASGGCIVQSDLKDTSAQNFLRGHDRPVTCLDMTQSGTLAVSGQVHAVPALPPNHAALTAARAARSMARMRMRWCGRALLSRSSSRGRSLRRDPGRRSTACSSTTTASRS
jgi:hypothetical protein